jgi:tRNA-dihydrouridine synthase B
MVGRAAMGNPFIFREINHFFETGEILPPPSLEEKLKVMREQIELMIKYKGEHIGLLEARKHTAWYVKGLKGAANIRKMCGEIRSLHDIDLICEKIMEENKNEI